MKTVIYTVLGGVAAFIMGQVFFRWFIEPVQHFKKTKSEIAHLSVASAHQIYNADAIPIEIKEEIYQKLRSLSGQLHADLTSIPLYPMTRCIFRLPKADNVYEAATNLMGTANWIYSVSENKYDHIVLNMQKALDNLGIYIEPKDRVDRSLSK